MREIHRNLLVKDFPQPLEGVIQATVCATTGKILTLACDGHLTTQWYLQGTQPTEICNVHSGSSTSGLSIARLKTELYKSGQHLTEKIDSTPLKLNLDFLKSGYVYSEEKEIEEPKSTVQEEQTMPDYNYLME